MYISFENQNKTVVSRPNRNNPDARWYIAEQAALLFKEGSKYPDKFDLTLTVSDQESEANSVQPFSIGKYHLTEEAYGLDRNQNPVVDFTKLAPAKTS